MHLPVNHRLAGFYRVLATLVGLYVLAFGIVGAARTWGGPFFGRGEMMALGLRTNLGFALLSIVVGAVVVLGCLIGGNVTHYVNLFGGGVFWLAGLAMLTVLETQLNVLNFQVATCVVSFLIGTVLVLSGLYGKRGTAQFAAAEDTFRHTGRGAAAASVTRGDGS